MFSRLFASFKVSLTVTSFVLQTMGNLGSSDVDSRLEEQLIDGILYAFQEQTQEVRVVLTHWATGVFFQYLVRVVQIICTKVL